MGGGLDCFLSATVFAAHSIGVGSLSLFPVMQLYESRADRPPKYAPLWDIIDYFELKLFKVQEEHPALPLYTESRW